MVPIRAAALALVFISLAAVMPTGQAAAAPEAAPSSYDAIFTSPYFPQAVKEIDYRHQGTYALVYYAFGYMEARRNDWQSAHLGDRSQLLSPEFTYLMAADANGRGINDVGAALTTWGTCTYAKLGPVTHDYPATDPATWTTMVWSQAGESAWREAPEHRPLAGYAMDYSASALARIRTLLLQGVPIVVATYGLAGANQNGFLDDDFIISSGELAGTSFSHYQTIIGYDDAKQNDGEVGAVRVMSSYGASLGDGGSFWITYSALQKMADLQAKDLTPYVNDAFLYYVDMACAPPTALMIWEYDTPPTQDCAMEIALVGAEGGALTTPVRPFMGSRWYAHTHHLPRFMCLDISAWTSIVQWPGTLLRVDQASTPGWMGAGGSLGCLVVEIYDNYDSTRRNPPTLVSGQTIAGLEWTPFRVLNDLTFSATVPMATAADAPGQRFLSSGAWTFYGVREDGAIGGSCLRTPESAFQEETRLETMMTGPGSIAFRWRSVADGVQGGLDFRVDGTTVRRLIGMSGWIDVNITIAEGTHRLTWAARREAEGAAHTLDDYCLLDGIRVKGLDDALEENDVPSKAIDLAEGELHLTCADADWYGARLNKGDGFRLELTVEGSMALDLFLRMPGGGERRATYDGSIYVLELSNAFDFMRVLVCVRAAGIDVGHYSMAMTYQRFVDNGALSRMALLSDGVIGTDENAVLSGSLSLEWQNAWSDAADLLVIWNWGDPSRSYKSYADWVGAGNNTGAIAFSDIRAPASAGTYYLFIVFRGGADPAQLASASFDKGGAVEWNDGDDIGCLGPGDVDRIRAEGRVWLRCLGEGGMVFTVPVPCAVLQVIVADVTPPNTTATLNGIIGDGAWFGSPVEVTLNAIDPSGVFTVRYRIDAGEWMTYLGAFRVMADGAHVVDYYSVDNLMHVETLRSVALLIDQGAPRLSCQIDGTIGLNGWYVGAVTLHVEAFDAASSVVSSCRVDGGPWNSIADKICLTIPGRHVVEMIGHDEAGNAASFQMEVLIDAEGPRLTLKAAGDKLTGEWFGSAVSICAESLDIDSGTALTWIRLDGGAWQAWNGSFEIKNAGRHILEGYAVDVAGNAGGMSRLDICIDLSAPVVKFGGTDTGNGLIALESAELSLVASDDVGGSAVFVRVDCGGWTSVRDGMIRLEGGVHTVQAYAVDLAGRIGQIASVSVVFDPEDPSARLQVEGSVGDGGWYRGPVVLSVNASDAQPGPVTAQLRVNGRDVNPSQFLLDSPGWHEIMYLARDRAGNVFGPVTVHLGVDAAAPQLFIEPSGPRGINGWYTGDVLLSVTGVDAASGIVSLECDIDGSGWQATDGRALVRYDGQHTVMVRCRDAAGNVASMKVEVLIDSSGPMMPFSDGEELRLKERGPALSLKLGDWCSGLASVRVRIDAGEPLLLDLIAPSVPLEQLSDGRHVLSIEARDSAGNLASREIALNINTNALDPDGPYGIAPLAAILAAIIIAVALILRWSARYR